MNVLAWAGTILALIVYVPLWQQIRAKTAHQNLLTWALWSALDLVVGATIIAQHGNWLLPMGYFFGSAVTVVVIARAGEPAKWTWFETLVVSMVVASLVVWYVSGSAVATVASTSAMLIGGLPQVRDAWREPHKMPLAAYCGYAIANLLSTAAGRNWSIAERFYPASAAAFCFVLVLLAARSFLPVQIEEA